MFISWFKTPDKSSKLFQAFSKMCRYLKFIVQQEEVLLLIGKVNSSNIQKQSFADVLHK